MIAHEYMFRFLSGNEQDRKYQNYKYQNCIGRATTQYSFALACISWFQIPGGPNIFCIIFNGLAVSINIIPERLTILTS